MKYWCAIIFFLLTACSAGRGSHLDKGADTKPKLPIIENLYLPKPFEIASADSIYKLTDDQIVHFRQYFDHPIRSNLAANKKISLYLKDELPKFEFQPDTLLPHLALKFKRGNCLSMAMLTKAFADLVDVDVRYELVATPPTYQKAGDLVLISQHVRTLLLNSKPDVKKGFFLLWRGGIRVDYFPSRGSLLLKKVEKSEFDAMYFNNKAAEALGSREDAIAFGHLKQALVLNPTDIQSINTLAILHDRAGYTDYAENLYLYGLTYGRESFELLNNYFLLLQRQERKEEARKISLRLRKYDDPNPYKWVELGNKEYAAKQFSSALYYYSKAKKMASYLHEAHAGIARSQYSLGKIDLAKQSFKKAIERSHGQTIFDIYESEYRNILKYSEEG